ncbi:peptidyl-tRNA hydrolase 2, mitochondrial-like [Galleria mellonella]|uniref:peptidyl-tRNA hydrolase n=1 Tax=Galleria mellonella TaxID=7137 RepID=A0A6J1WKQ4_GALME|nr:peptidyl-tRNA hydrolase 2, mitochondrial-like [Galleria mellonella]
MDLNPSFWAGLGCGLCIGLSVFVLKKYFGSAGSVANTAKAIKKFASNNEYKLVLVVRTDLNMSKGKIAAQCGHAAVGAFEKAQRKDPEGLKLWQFTGQAKIALKTDSVDEIKQIADNAKKMGLITSLIRDAGRTQIAPNSITVLGVGPAPKDIVDKVTGHLKLL